MRNGRGIQLNLPDKKIWHQDFLKILHILCFGTDQLLINWIVFAAKSVREITAGIFC